MTIRDHAGPALSRHRLGAELRRLREARSLRLEDVAAKLDLVPSTLSRIETGKAPTRSGYLTAMFDLYGVDDPAHRGRLVGLAREGRRKDGWANYADVLPVGAGSYLGLEAAASLARTFSVQCVPSLLQTADYAAAILRAWRRPAISARQVGELVQLQLRRQDLIRRNGLRLHVILDESALLRSMGPAQLMDGQLEHLLRMTDDPAVTVQVLALASARPALSSPFTVLSFPDPADPDVACYDGLGSQVVIIKCTGDVGDMNDTFNALAASAMPPASSADLIKNLLGRARHHS
jgi:transcriptional regulator with XRE-family HTH domain